MEQAPKIDKRIDQMDLDELLKELVQAEKRQGDFLTEVESNPDENRRDAAKESAAAQFDAILVMTERIGEIKRKRIEEMRKDWPEREIPTDDPLARNIRPII